MNLLKRIVFPDSFGNSTSSEDLLSVQRMRLFRTATIISLVVYTGFVVQIFVVLPGHILLLAFMLLLFVIAFVNYFALAYHKKPVWAYSILIGIWFLLLHIDTYYSGGIRNSANFYMAVLLLTAYMLLGSRGGKLMAFFAVAHFVYFYIVSSKTDWITYELIGSSPALLNLYYFITTTISILALSFQSDYIERSKNEVIADIRAGKEKLERSERILEKNNRELQRKNKELEEFSSVASHDLQEPLKTASAFAQLLQKKYKDQLDEDANLYLDFIVGSSVRMQVIIKDLLEYSRIGYDGKLEKIDCNTLMLQLLADLSQLIKEQDATIGYDKLPVIVGYATEIKLLFQNLLINAIKFRKPGIAPIVNISCDQKDGYWYFSVSDNGIGIDEKYHDKIFVIFQRLHSEEAFKGSGIGLAHCKKIAELHHGSITVQSTPGVGSTFKFSVDENLSR